MKKHISTLIRICASVAALAMCAPAQAEMGQSSIGPSLVIGSGNTNIGIDSKFGVSDNISVRPFIYFPSGGTDFGTALTYDFKLPNTGNNVQVTPFVGGAVDVNTGGNTSLTTVSLTGGADFDVTDSVRLKAGLVVPLSTDQGQSTAVTLGAGFRF